MRTLSRLLARLRNVATQRRGDERLREEIESHIAAQTDDNMRSGMDPAEARRQARMKFGGVEAIREQYHAEEGLPLLESLLHDCRYALRQFRRAPGYASAAVLTLALGIGANTAIFSIVNGLLFSSLHIRDEGRLAVIAFRQKDSPWQQGLSLPEYQMLQTEAQSVFSATVAEDYSLDGLSTQGHKPDRVFTDYVTGNYFEVLSIRPLLGRFFRPNEGVTPGADAEVVLSYAYWKQHFARDPDIIGRHIALNEHPLTVIGVTPRDFRGLNTLFGIQVYVPLAMVVPIESTPLADFSKETNRALFLYGRMRPGVTAKQANAVLSVVASRIAAKYPRSEEGAKLRTFSLETERTGGFDPANNMVEVAVLFMGLAGMVLLLACVNVGSLLLVRASVREREMAMRSALGAGRGRLIRQMLTESILLAVIGGLAGIVLGLWGSSLLSSINLETDLPLQLDFGLDWSVLMFSAAIAVGAGTLVGIIPALRLGRANLNLILREGGHSIAGKRNRFRDSLVAVEVGSALMLLIVAGLFTRSLARTEHAKLGFNPENVLTAMVDPSEIGYNDGQTREFYAKLLMRIRALPGVEAATTAESIPFGMVNKVTDAVTVPGNSVPSGQEPPRLGYNVVVPDYFHTMQILLVEGRTFTDDDNEKSPYVAIVNQAMAKRFWPHQDCIGKTFVMNSNPAHSLHVVGVTENARYADITGAIPPYFYIPFLQDYAENSLQALELRTKGNPSAMVPDVERTIHAIAPDLPVFEVKTLHQALYSPNGLLGFEIVAGLATVMGCLGLVLAIVGVYGVLSYLVQQKTSEIGIRMALGAQRGDVFRIVYRHGLWIIGIGLVMGLAVSFALTRLLRSMLEVSATDPATYLGVSAILTTISLLACYIPARRAMRLNPMRALRME